MRELIASLLLVWCCICCSSPAWSGEGGTAASSSVGRRDWFENGDLLKEFVGVAKPKTTATGTETRRGPSLQEAETFAARARRSMEQGRSSAAMADFNEAIRLAPREASL